MVSEMSSRRNKIILEEMLSKIDAELAEKEKDTFEENPAAEEILSKYGSGLDNVFYSPKYKVPKRCPPIDLEIRTNTTRTLYLMIPCKNGLNSRMLTRAANSLKTAGTQASDAILCAYFIDDTVKDRIFIERHKKVFKQYGIRTSFSSQPLPETADKYK